MSEVEGHRARFSSGALGCWHIPLEVYCRSNFGPNGNGNRGPRIHIARLNNRNSTINLVTETWSKKMGRFLQDLFESFLVGMRTMAMGLAVLTGAALVILTAAGIVAKILENIL